MKIRTGFVSNSSSSSFIIFGKIMGYDELKRVFKFTDDEMKDIKVNGLWDYEDKNLKGVDHKYLSYGCEKEFVIGKSLKGNGSQLIEMIMDMDILLGGGCIVYRGIDSDGDCSLD